MKVARPHPSSLSDAPKPFPFTSLADPAPQPFCFHIVAKSLEGPGFASPKKQNAYAHLCLTFFRISPIISTLSKKHPGYTREEDSRFGSGFPLAASLRVSEGYVGAEADHAEAGGEALAAPEGSAGFEAAFEGQGEQHDEKIGGSVQRNGEDSQGSELPENVAVLRGDELRNEGKEKQRGLGIQDFGDDALAEGSERGARGAEAPFGVAGADHAKAEPDEISSSREFDGVKRHGGRGENRGDACGGGEDVEESSDERAERRVKTFAAPSGKRPREDVEDSRSRRDSQNHR